MKPRFENTLRMNGSCITVLPSGRWLEPKVRMDDACRVYNDRSEEWAALRDKSVPAVWQQASTRWQSMVQPLMALMGRDRFNAPGLQEIVRFMRHVRGQGSSFSTFLATSR